LPDRIAALRVVAFGRDLYAKLIGYALKFGVVGLLCYVVDVGLFNLLRLGVFGSGHFFQGPIGAKILSVAIATVLSWFGNRYWTFRAHRRSDFLVELGEFVIVSVGGLLLQLVCLGVSHYVLDQRSLLADNLSSNIVGLGIATGFRFLLYRFWVYAPTRSKSLSRRTDAATLTSLLE
jgi:putative flippase GtrA